jgi:hypothetical protein
MKGAQNKMDDKEIKPTNETPVKKKSETMMGVGIAIGVAVGVALDNIGLGIALGLIFGVAASKKQDSKNQ